MVQALEPKIATLENQARKTMGDLMRRLAELEKLTGVALIANMGRLMAEVAHQNQENDLDPRLKSALGRGIRMRDKLEKAEGGSFSAEEAAAEIGMSKAGVLKRLKAGRLIAWQEERQKAVRFPKWQFVEGKVLPGLEVVLASLDSNLDNYGRLLFFLSNTSFLKGDRPLDALRKGEIHKVTLAAEGYGE